VCSRISAAVRGRRGGPSGATVRQAEAKYEEMVETYRQAIIQAVHDVEDALAEIRLTGEQRKALLKATGHAKQAYEISTFSFDKHAIDFLSLLESQRSLYTTEDAEVTARADLLKASVDLFMALGGGLDAPHC
jgi:outer membrane protein TolC